MKYIPLFAFVLLLSCQGKKDAQVQTLAVDGDAVEASSDDAAAEVHELPSDPIEVNTDGSIDAKTWTPGEEASVTFSRIPASVAEFKQVQQQIGGTPQGAVALQLMAFEMYNRDAAIGTECIKLNNAEINVPSVMRRMPDIFSKTDEYYPRLHLVATYFDGATPENGFNPSSPYKVKVRTNKVHQYERSESLKGYVLYLDVYSTGYDTPWRGCEVVKQKGSDYYVVSNSPSMYVQCKQVPFDAEEDYKGLK